MFTRADLVVLMINASLRLELALVNSVSVLCVEASRGLARLVIVLERRGRNSCFRDVCDLAALLSPRLTRCYLATGT